ncbi:MAG: hypothetical protein KatS3mg101_0630 [Patescibacteria group bacterium]|nr:MAG: hypothetical protein KatS3mg101_0630 [Patescibacteria group bacterium]
MKASNIEESVSSIRYENEGLPQKEELSTPWLLEKLDPSAIASRTLVKSLYINNEALVQNIQRHEASRGRLYADIYEELLNKNGMSLKDSKILEVGAGPGALCLALQEKGAKVVSLDIRDGRIFHSTDVPFLIADGRGLPFLDGSFDIVSLTSVLHHVPEKFRRPLLDEALRVSEVLLIQEDCLTHSPKDTLMKIVDDAVSGEIGTHQAGSHMTKDQWVDYFKENRLEILGSRDHYPEWLGVGIQKSFFVVTKTEAESKRG